MTLQEFLTLVRRAREPHVVVGSDGEPDCVVVPFARYRELVEGQSPSLTERAVSTAQEVKHGAPRRMSEHGAANWDAMMEEVDPEPQFRFEPVDEESPS